MRKKLFSVPPSLLREGGQGVRFRISFPFLQFPLPLSGEGQSEGTYVWRYYPTRHTSEILVRSLRMILEQSENCLSLTGRARRIVFDAAGEGPNSKFLSNFRAVSNVWRTKQSRHTDVPHPDPCASGTSRHRERELERRGKLIRNLTPDPLPLTTKGEPRIIFPRDKF